MALLKATLDMIQNEYSKPEPEWETGKVHARDLDFLKEECSKDSEFDPQNHRKRLLEDMYNGKTNIMVEKCSFGQVFAVFEDEKQMLEMPWGLWGRILRIFSVTNSKPFRVYFMANKHLREFPPHHSQITPQNINGGYTYRCNRETILIYRAEDATRVLLHELQHSCCLDNVEDGVDLVEAETEAWAELLYVALMSRAKKYIFKDFIQRQSEWMRKQNALVKQHMQNPHSMEFPWRYTIGKEEVWRRWGILRDDDMKPIVEVGKSLRLTYPPNKTLKKIFQVAEDSTIL
jgi:hypothetical protein